MASDDDVSAQQRPSPPSFNSTTNTPASPTSRASLEASGKPSAFIAFVHPFRERADIVQPLAWPAKCNNSSYNPTSVARDVLLAVGQHPDRPGLNHHLLGLKDHFKYVDDNSDLSTLRWDLINPAVFALKQANMPPIYGQQNAAVGNHRSSFGTGSGTTGEAQLVAMEVKGPFDNKLVLHPSQYRQSNLQFSSTPNPAAPPRSGFQVVVPTSPAKFYGKSHSITEPRPYLSDGTSSSPRRGRPPKGLEPRLTNILPKKRGRPFANKAPVEFTPKKRGRSFKTAESELKAKARANSSGTSTPTAYKKKGRPFKVRHQLFIAQPLPVFHPFLCEWKGCEAELHNLETLRLHIHILHKKRVEGKVPCLWAKCGAKKAVDGEDGEKKVVDDHPRFASRKEWKDHLETKHLIPFSWHMGDGPKGTDLSGKPRGIINPLWLNDENGNEITPSVKGQALEEGRASDLNKKRFRKMKGMNIFKEKAEKNTNMKGMSGGMGMLPPQVSSDDEDEDTGTGADEGDDDLDLNSEALEERRGERQVVRLDYDDDDKDSGSDGDGERGEHIDDDSDVQMAGP
ncbi:hypothetical protein IFR05_005655 [Cadophora sp. M221]|nr:hypothetical protein IFR05_005655 [Cadophora sp. M221]